MHRAPIVLTATAAGLAATLGFRAHPPVATTATTAQLTLAPAAPASSSATSSSPAAPATTKPAGSTAKTVTSAVEANRYGDVQLKVTVRNGRITGVQALQLPDGDPRSAQINAYAGPRLRQSALSVGSASIDAVSGATYTSAGYEAALQSALDKAGASPSTAAAS